MLDMQQNSHGEMAKTRDRTGVWLRVEGAAIFGAATWAYGSMSGDWLLYFVLFLVPDLFALGYLRGPRVGAFFYNLVHTYTGPVVVGGASMFFGWSVALPFVLIWIAHIGIDRAVGYGLKKPDGFKKTHLG